MAVRIRLSRAHLTRNSPRYTLVATQASSRTTSKPLETLGSYSPLPTIPKPISTSPNGQSRDPSVWGSGLYPSTTGKDQVVGEKKVEWNETRIKYWLSLGAKPSKTVERLLNQAGIIQSNPIQTLSQQLGSKGGKKLVVSRNRRINDAVRLAEKQRGELPVAQQQQQQQRRPQ
ncbi:hypothetical protein JCM3765_000364 [Sporobolomyces pararoseus]